MVHSPFPAVCGHTQVLRCGEDKLENTANRICTEECGKTLRCGHPCRLICGIHCLGGKLHGPCVSPCERQLLCGHDCKGRICGEPCAPCDGNKKCLVQICDHKKCKSKCEDPCKSSCKEKCGAQCPHFEKCANGTLHLIECVLKHHRVQIGDKEVMLWKQI